MLSKQNKNCIGLSIRINPVLIDDSQDNWSEFKSEFNQDMDELGRAFNDLK